MANLGKIESRSFSSLSEYLRYLELSGKSYFLSSDLEEILGMKKESISVALSRLAKKSRIKMVKRGFGLLLGVDGRGPEPSSYIDAMMKHIGASYYVGLLSAASYWGASHQAAMSYQVFADKVTKDITFERGRVEFISRKNMQYDKWVKRVATSKGYFFVSSPELTSIDLLCFPQKSGHLNNIATVIGELVEKWDGRIMASLCLHHEIPTVALQRLGYILDRILLLEKESAYVEKALRERKPANSILSKLVEGKKMSDYQFDEKWCLYINTEVEVD